MRAERIKQREKSMPCWLAAFLVNLAVAVAAVAPFIMLNHGYMAMSHDFSAQEIAFNMLMNDTVKSGNLLWNWGIDLGGNFLESFSFYNVGSIFFWILLLFPADSMSRVMGWMIILKFAAAGAVSAAYFARHLKKRSAVIFGSLLYTFSGFACGTVVFYHFQDAIALFPLMLIGLELLVEEKKRGRLLLACVLNLLCNYVFFVGEVLFLAAYYVVRYLLPERKMGKEGLRKILGSAFDCILEGAIGVMVSGILLLPSLNGILGNSRISSHLPGSSWFSMTTRDYLLLLKAVLVPAEPMNFMSSVSGSDWMSNMAYLPMTGILLVLVYVLYKRDWISTLLKLSLLTALIPILNSVFMFFNNEQYRRWYYMAILIMALASAKAAEEPQKYSFRKVGVGLLVLYVFYWLMLNVVKWERDGGNLVFHKRLFYFGFLTAVAGILLTLAVVRWGGARRTALLCALSALWSGVVLAAAVFEYQVTTDNTNIDFKSFCNTYGENVYHYLTDVPGMLDREILPYRYYFDEDIGYTYYNLAMTCSLPSINSFSSTVHSSITEFYDALGVGRRTWTNAENSGTRELLSARYIVSAAERPEYTFVAELSNSNGQTMYLYENERALPIGFAYDRYITRSEFDMVDKSIRPAVMLGMLVVRDEDAGKVDGVLEHCPMEVLAAAAKEQRFDYIEDRRKECSRNFSYGDNVVEAQIMADSEKYAFFSIPYDRYWEASVNGQEQEILNCNGFMAVRISEGENAISLEYHYKPLKYGIGMSIVGIVASALYLFLMRKSGLLAMNRRI